MGILLGKKEEEKQIYRPTCTYPDFSVARYSNTKKKLPYITHRDYQAYYGQSTLFHHYGKRELNHVLGGWLNLLSYQYSLNKKECNMFTL